jgi:hypothetical protein
MKLVLGSVAALAVGLALAALTLPRSGYRMACYAPELRTGFSYSDCWAAAEAAIDDVGDRDEPVAVAVWVYRGCAPGTFCPLLQSSGGITDDGLAAIVGVRLGNGAAELRTIRDLAGWTAASSVGGLGEPNAFVDSIFATRGAMIGP